VSLARRLILALAARLPAPRLDNCDADVAEKRARVTSQLREVALTKARVTCGCGVSVKLIYSFRCLYCGEFYCQRCAEIHFGKTRAAYEHERSDYVLTEGRGSGVEGGAHA
jgi:hypothetical protein